MPEPKTPLLSDLHDQLDAGTNRGRADGEPDPVLGERPVLVFGTPLRTESLSEPTDRRAFLARAGTLSLAIPGIGAALTACGPAQGSRDSAAGGERHDEAGEHAQRPQTPHRNSDSKLDSAVLGDRQHHGSSATSDATQGAGSTAYHRFDPVLPPRATSGRVQLHWHARDTPVRISEDTVVAGWTFEGDIPGPVVHCRVGDTVEFTLTNDAVVPHSMDFHAAQIDPKVAFRSVAQGQSVSYTFKPEWAGAFMYHCGTAPVLMHIGSGMYGALIVEPAEPLPPAKEFVLVQSEYYLAEEANGVRAFDYQKMLATMPDLVVFNGRPNQYVKEPIRVKVGDRVRFWVVDAGPTHPCQFHVVGEQFDTVYLGSPPSNAIRGVQTFGVPAGGGMCFELVCDVPGEFPFVNHDFGHGQKGAIGFLDVKP
jgi:nitrite reductase (NO-forming)